ncbi:aldo/keto reductase [Geodermatophilus obscurus]|uniref:Aldo/keto reductase n=1 Tax=Geodermatophilus obscurus (strain ATCC 25078 / DSM 43160 / JCM 3152 / CCUG 61914 / KCC A-0152 / KCTC 9177 / NBRC 13315 / NRRL B-3577 / G-20) TaxID=526225 RepID=D2SBG0_GEOOG|nr:aldo/keto reductase [Geodermatophilus obscurus]ADB74108.1 aldo/keto reductase [Geodermatophilus obscurus DSM 43160]
MTTVAPSDTFSIGGDLPVHRLGYGAMQLPGPGVWGEPADPENARRVVRAAVEQGVDFIDTADSYGPVVSERIIAEALHPYPEDLVIATKAGLTRQGPGIWTPVGRPAYLKQQVELSLRTLRLERIDLIQLHRIDGEVRLADQLGAFKELQEEGKVRHIGVSEVSVAELDEARSIVDVVSVQNLYNLTNRQSQDVLDHATEHGIGFIPWFPIATGDLAAPDSPVADIARELDATPSQVALAWLLHTSPVVLPIPGTKSVEHLTENLGAAQLRLSDEDMARLDALA